MDQAELKKVLEMHRKWVLSAGGEQADLSYANLSRADLSRADLRYADLSYANLSRANLSSANLSYADLSYANLSYANLRYANLSSANLRSANLSEIKEDFFGRLLLAKQESVGLYDAIMRGKVNGSVYEGECVCFVGTVAKIRKEHHEKLTCDLKPDPDSLTEKWFLAFEKGVTPDRHPVAKITAEWIEEFAKANGVILPEYKLVSSAEFPAAFDKQIEGE